jgi:cytoskeletal protein CcmA (bactofilin family)
MSEQEKQTLVEEGTEFSGTLRAKCKVVVRGSVEGELEAPSVEVAQGGRMQGNIKAARVDSRGVLAGSVSADEITLAGEVKSNTVIRARSIAVKLSAQEGHLHVTFGDTVLEVGDMPGDQPERSDHHEIADQDALLDGHLMQLAEASAEDHQGAAEDDAGNKRRRKGRKHKDDDEVAHVEADPVGDPAGAPAT